MLLDYAPFQLLVVEVESCPHHAGFLVLDAATHTVIILSLRNAFGIELSDDLHDHEGLVGRKARRYLLSDDVSVVRE